MQKKNTSGFFSQMASHQNFGHFVLYCVSYFIFGMVLTSLGPMFPYLADKQNRLQTQYSVLFTSRALGFISGCFLAKWLGKKLYLHQIISIGLVLNGVFSILFNIKQDMYFRAFLMLFSSLGISFQDVIINLSAVETFKGQDMAMWLQLIHGMMGIGGLLGPVVVYYFELNTLTFLGILLLCSIPFYFYFESPEKIVNIEKLQQQDFKILDLPTLSLYLISFGFFISVGQETGYGGWVSSYAVLNDFSTKQHATFFSSMYWISITFFRFIMTLVQGSASRKIRYLGYMGVFSTVISYILIFHVNSEMGLISMSIMYGFCNSALYPLLMTIPQQFGYKLSINESTTFLLWTAIGDGCMGVIVGKMMGWFSYNWLLYSIGLLNFMLVIVMIINRNILLREKERNGGQGKLEKLIADTLKTDKKEHHFFIHRQEGTQLKQVVK